MLTDLSEARQDQFAKGMERTLDTWTHASWSQRHAQKLREARELNPESVFIGDSIAQGWEAAGPLPLPSERSGRPPPASRPRANREPS